MSTTCLPRNTGLHAVRSTHITCERKNEKTDQGGTLASNRARTHLSVIHLPYLVILLATVDSSSTRELESKV